MNPLAYRRPVDALFTGSSFGNIHAFARLGASTDLLGLWNASDNQYYAGEWRVDILVDGIPVHADDSVFAPAHQTTFFTGGEVQAEKTFFLPLLPEAAADAACERTALFCIHLTNAGRRTVRVTLRHHLVFPGVITDRFTKQPPEDQLAKKVRIREHDPYCVVITEGRPDEARVFGSAIPWSSLESDATTLTAEYAVDLAGGGEESVNAALAFSPEGADAALRAFQCAADAAALLRQTNETMADILSRALMHTPDPLINRALQWAKINMIRVRHQFRTGVSFTNDPPQDIVVIRDLAWFVLGADYFLPGLARKMLEFAMQYGCHGGGKLTEFLHADEPVPVQHDYFLNINDDTPLFVWGLLHYVRATGDREFLKRHWPVLRNACDWLCSQTVDGLVRCTAKGTSVWGICSWRNIIDGYTLSGAVTEINALCYLALRLTAEAAAHLGHDDEHARFAGAADRLQREINRTLVSERTGLYLLNLDNDGIAHHDLTGDLVFPVLAGVPDDATRRRILQRLLETDFWTGYGVRTVAPSETTFDPDASYQLLGGVWPNLTAWVAYCLREDHPEKVAEAMRNIYRMSEMLRPVDGGFIVPGEFPERLHGADFSSEGMTLSPWTPPTYLWLGVEGLLGVQSTWEGMAIKPALPSTWNWIAVKDLSVLGASMTAFLWDGVLYSTRPVQSSYPVQVGAGLGTETDDPRIFSAALKLEREIVLFVASDEQAEGNVRFGNEGVWHEKHVALRAGEAKSIRIPG